eukprot:6471949-Amphidinium_carterae.1
MALPSRFGRLRVCCMLVLCVLNCDDVDVTKCSAVRSHMDLTLKNYVSKCHTVFKERTKTNGA